MPRGPQRGDFTGQQRQRMMEEKAEELAERQKEIGLINQVEFVREEEGIWDPVTGEMLDLPPEAQEKIKQLEEPVVVEDDPIYNPMKDLQTTMTQPVPKTPAPNALEVQDLGDEPATVEEEWRVIRVNTDIEDMTYGVGNQMTFLRGKRYKVPRDLYIWLESRGVVYH